MNFFDVEWIDKNLLDDCQEICQQAGFLDFLSGNAKCNELFIDNHIPAASDKYLQSMDLIYHYHITLQREFHRDWADGPSPLADYCEKVQSIMQGNYEEELERYLPPNTPPVERYIIILCLGIMGRYVNGFKNKRILQYYTSQDV